MSTHSIDLVVFLMKFQANFLALFFPEIQARSQAPERQ